jgi:ERO1-like protein alpha
LPWKQESEKLDTKIEDKFKRWVDKYNTDSPHWISDDGVEKGTYVNLLQNSEAYTGYQGQHIWNAIFSENCFSDSLEKLCLEEKVFYKIFSGLISNINIQIGSNYFNFEKNSTSSYVNLTMIKERVTDHKERVNNLFFLYYLHLDLN